jgi:ABC-type glycerol-3-phosphate transport system substrate-binding protein
MVVLLIATLLVACGGFDATPQASPEPDSAGPIANAPDAPDPDTGQTVTITFGTYEYERSIYEPLVKTFHSENPTIHVQLVSLDAVRDGADSSDFNAYMRQMVSAADTLTSFGSSGPEAIEHGYIRDLAPFMDANPAFDRDDFFPGTLHVYENGAIGLLPSKMSVQLLAYNRDLWATRGLDPPKPDWTWEDLLSAASRIAQKRGDTIEVYGLMQGQRSEVLRNGELNGISRLLADTPPEEV